MTSTLSIDLFIRAKQLVPSRFIWEKNHAEIITLEYLDRVYPIKDKRILKWFPQGEEEVLKIPPFIFEDIMGDAPDELVIDIPKEGKDIMKLRLYNCILMTYIGAMDIAYEIHKEIYINRYLLPEWWRHIGGLHIIEKDIPVPKYDGSPSQYLLSDFNGTYLPMGISKLFMPRILIRSEQEYPELWDILEKNPIFQAMLFGIRNTFSGKVDINTFIATSVLGIGSWDYVIEIKHIYPQDLLHLVPKEYLYDLIKCISYEEYTPKLFPLISTLHPEQIKSLDAIPIELLMNEGTFDDRKKILPHLIHRLAFYICGGEIEHIRNVLYALSENDIKKIISNMPDIREIDHIYSELSEDVKKYACEHIIELLAVDASGFINQLDKISIALLQDIASYMKLSEISITEVDRICKKRLPPIQKDEPIFDDMEFGEEFSI